MEAIERRESTDTIGRRTLIKAGGALAGVAAVTSVVGTPAQAATLPSGASFFEPLENPIRMVDTRYPTRYRPYTEASVTSRRINLKAQAEIPADATAVVATLTGVKRSDDVWIAIRPLGATNLTSNLNLFLGANANLATVEIPANGWVELVSSKGCDVILDVLGVYRGTTEPVSSGRFVALADAARPLQTYSDDGSPRALPASGKVIELEIGREMRRVDPSVKLDQVFAVMANITATQGTGAGHISVVPGDKPNDQADQTSSLNVNRIGEIRAAAVVVRVEHRSDGLWIKIYVHTATHLAFDVFGYFTNAEADKSTIGLFVPRTPRRIMDTRDQNQSSIDWRLTKGRLWPHWSIEGLTPDTEGLQAVALNVTMTQPRGAGHVTVFPARREMPPTSNVNHDFESATFGWDVPNHVVTAITKYGYQISSWGGTALVVDYFGYYTGSLQLPKFTQSTNYEPGPVGPDWILRVPKINRDGGWSVTTVHTGDGSDIANRGLSWYWEGTGLMGNSGSYNPQVHTAVFGHRTEAGGPYYNIHLLGPGDRWEVQTMDGRVFVFEYVRRDLTDAKNANILAATRYVEGRSMSLIACTYGLETKLPRREWWEPTDLDYRIIVTGKLVDWYAV